MRSLHREDTIHSHINHSTPLLVSLYLQPSILILQHIRNFARGREGEGEREGGQEGEGKREEGGWVGWIVFTHDYMMYMQQTVTIEEDNTHVHYEYIIYAHQAQSEHIIKIYIVCV